MFLLVIFWFELSVVNTQNKNFQVLMGDSCLKVQVKSSFRQNSRIIKLITV